MKKILLFLKKEFIEMLPPTIFFFVVFHILYFIKSLVANEYGVSISSSIAAAIGSLIVGKAILIVDSLKALNLFQEHNLIHRILWKIFIYSVFVFLFRYLEEVIPLMSKYDSFNVANRNLINEIKWSQFWTIQIVLFIFLTIYISFVELIKVIGKERFLEIVFKKKKDYKNQ
ncbi:hypothetical protein [Hanstruepera ponticola]|uniref:hypothetical protein n=1 Tax=Hanstruepera ponticola TaxID=2042995 RepID=UPI000CF0462B|nr:hypothetical protein [Hanstruepera ponticola]